MVSLGYRVGSRHCFGEANVHFPVHTLSIAGAYLRIPPCAVFASRASGGSLGCGE